MKTVEEIYGALCADFAQRTGLEAGGDGDLAVRLYAVAAQVQALYVQTDWVGRQCFPQTAAGEFLDRHAQLRGLARRQAAQAEGTIRFQCDAAASSDLDIPLGTVCMTAGLVRFETTEAAVLGAGETYVDVPARAVEPGTGGNVAAGSILTMAVAPVGVSRCTNPAPFTGGTGTEGDEELRQRVLETFQRLPNGANAAFYQQGALSYPGVAAAVVLPRSRGTGTVDVVVATAEGVPEEELLDGLEAWFDERREIAVDVAVRAPETQTVNLSLSVKAAEGADFTEVSGRVEAAIENWFGGERLGQDVLLARLGALLFSVDGVANYAITAPAADVAVDEDVLPVLGTLSIGEMT